MDRPHNYANPGINEGGSLFETKDGFGFHKSLGLFVLGLVSGIMGGMLSMGGGVLLVSGLIFIFHYGIIIMLVAK